VAGVRAAHTITVSEQNQPPVVSINLEQQGRPTTTLAATGGLAGVLSEVLDDPAQDHTFDWSGSDSGLFDPVTANDPAYLLDPSGLSAGLYDFRLSVTDDGMPPLNSLTSSLVKLVDANPVLSVDEDVDGDGTNDADEGTGDRDGDRIPDYLDNGPLSNVLPIDTAGRQLETLPGLSLRLGANAFLAGDGYVGLVEQSVGVDGDNGYPDAVVDFDVGKVPPGGRAPIVIPLLQPIPEGAVYRNFVRGQWVEFTISDDDAIASAAGDSGACPMPGAGAYSAGLGVGAGCIQLTITDGGPNDADGIADGVIRNAGGLSVPVSATTENLRLVKSRLVGAGTIAVARFRIQSDSGDAILRSLTIEASGPGDDTLVDNVLLVVDTNGDGELSNNDTALASGRFSVDDGMLTFLLDEPYEVSAGITDMLIVYEISGAE
jgi:hypothetical protein